VIDECDFFVEYKPTVAVDLTNLEKGFGQKSKNKQIKYSRSFFKMGARNKQQIK